MKRLFVGIVLFLGMQSVHAIPLYYTFEVEIQEVKLTDGFYTGPVREGDSVFYKFLIDTEQDSEIVPDTPEFDYFFLSLISIDYGHGLDIQTFDTVGFGLTEIFDLGFDCLPIGCNILIGPPVSFHSTSMFSEWYQDGDIGADVFLIDGLLSDEIPTGKVTGLTVSEHANPVVEPASIILLVIGLFGLGYLRRRKYHSSALRPVHNFT